MENTSFRAFEKKRQSICNGRPELLQIRVNADYFHGKILEGSTIYTDDWKIYDSLILNSYKHYRVFHHENKFTHRKHPSMVSNASRTM